MTDTTNNLQPIYTPTDILNITKESRYIKAI